MMQVAKLESRLTAKPAKAWIKDAKGKLVPKALFGDFWFEGELCICFADSNVGKSILAVQIADSISKGKPIPKFSNEAPQEPVIYFDFELSEKQFERRYSKNYTSHYGFHKNLIRVAKNNAAHYNDVVNYSFEQDMQRAIIESGAKKSLLIIWPCWKTILKKHQSLCP